MKIVPDLNQDGSHGGQKYSNPHFFRWILLLWDIDDERIIDSELSRIADGDDR